MRVRRKIVTIIVMVTLLISMLPSQLIFAADTLSVRLSTNANSINVGDSIKLTAEASGGSGQYTYSYLIWNKTVDSWYRVPFSSNATYTWKAGSEGTRVFYVEAKDSNGKVKRSAGVTVVTCKNELKLHIGVDKTTVKCGENVTIFASASGGDGNYTYSYLICNIDKNEWYRFNSVFSSNATYTWKASSVGNRKFYVEVKDKTGKIVRSEGIKVSVVSGEKLTVSEIVSEETVNVGDNIKITAKASGGSGNYKYSFLVWNKTINEWHRFGDFSSINELSWKAGSIGTRVFYAEVKDSEGTVIRSVGKTVVTEEKKPSVISVTGVSLNKTNTSLTVGDTETLTATITPSNATDKGTTWKSSNTSVATVSNDGKVTAKGAGSATITVETTDGNKKATCVVTVKEPVVHVTGISITNGTNVALDWEESYQIQYKISPSNATNKGVTWTSSDTTIATVNNSGLITAKCKRGKTTITASTNDGNKTASFVLHVYKYKSGVVVPDFSGDKYCQIQLKANRGLVVDCSNSINDNGNPVLLFDGSDKTKLNQLWQFHDYRSVYGGYAVVPGCNKRGIVLDVHRNGNSYDSPLESGCLVDVWTLGDDAAASMWELVRLWDDDSYMIRLKNTTLCLSAQSATSGTQLCVKTFNPFDPMQVWCFETVVLNSDPVTQKINNLRNVYVDGQYWNKYNGLDHTGTIVCPCGNNTCPYNCACSCGAFEYGGTEIAGQCHGFALKMAYEVFGENANYWKERHTNTNSIYAGDVIRINNDSHTIFVVKVDGNNIYYVDCNWTGRCKVRWDGCYTRSQLSGIVTYIAHKSGNTSLGK